jgi:hypothetical protein
LLTRTRSRRALLWTSLTLMPLLLLLLLLLVCRRR